MSFDENNHAVPADIINKDAKVKAYGEHIDILLSNKIVVCTVIVKKLVVVLRNSEAFIKF